MADQALSALLYADFVPVIWGPNSSLQKGSKALRPVVYFVTRRME